MKTWGKLALAAGVLGGFCYLSFELGRRSNRQKVTTIPSVEASSATTEVVETQPKRRSDEEIGEEIARLHSGLSDLNWGVVIPLKEFESGKIGAEELRRRTAEPELKALQVCTRIHELANELSNPEARSSTVKFTGAVLQRHRGMTLIIEGYSTRDDAKVVAGSKLFEQGRNNVMESAVNFGDPNLPQTQQMRQLLEAYKESTSDN